MAIRSLRTIHLVILLCLAFMQASAQRFYNLTASEVRVDSVLPVFSHVEAVASVSPDSLYNFEIAYPEFVDMPSADVEAYRRLSPGLPPELPVVTTNVVLDRKRPSLVASFCPVVYRHGGYQVLASFMLRRIALAKPRAALSPSSRASQADTVAPANRYASHSVLRDGKWAKIRVPATGIYQLTDAVVRQAGFANPERVKIYGYGGNLQNEVLTAADLMACDDLHELPTCTVGNRRLFYGKGPVSYQSASTDRRTRNYYSNYGYYFLTESDAAPEQVDSATFVASFYDSPEWWHDLYEEDGFSYLQGGRNFFNPKAVAVGDSIVLTFDRFGDSTSGRLYVNVTSSGTASTKLSFNGNALGTLAMTSSETKYKLGFQASGIYTVEPDSTNARQKLVISVVSGNPVHLDFASIAWNDKKPLPDLAAAVFPAPEYVYGITNQDHHADPQADMVIIIPTSQKLLAQAQRLKTFHEEHDGMRVNIVPADELFNEFSSGTPDASAYRHYLKMLYDRAATSADAPKYLLLFGSSVWDNRMCTSACRTFSVDDYLLAFESEESFDKRSCYVDDGFYCMLDDGEGANPLTVDKLDVAVGRFPVTNAADAKAMVDKVISYNAAANKGSWLNTIFFMGDDGDNNQHMSDANSVADDVVSNHPGYLVKKVMWDAYQRETTASGNAYPDVSKIIKQQQAQGALIMDYVGHGSEWQFSHENVLHMSDFDTFTNANLPLWNTVGCDFMPFDRLADNIGTKAVLNPNGGALAVFGTTRTVYSIYNAIIHKAFMRHVLTYGDDGLPITIGEALRLAKNETTSSLGLANNTLQFALLGDPAVRLNLPTVTIVIDSINGIPVGDTGKTAIMRAGSLASVIGHVDGQPDFKGEVSLLVRDSKETITCRNNAGDLKTVFTYTDRTKTIYNGRNTVSGGRFRLDFAVPKDINYSDASGLVTAWAINDDHTVMAQGCTDDFIVGGSDVADNDSIGPSIYCYLNSPSFQNGGTVNTTPYFVAEVKDRDGINASGSGIGHDMQLCIDGSQLMTYSLNDNFLFDFGSYTSGTTYYNIPELAEGEHTLRFRAWDILNNATTAELRFNVVRSLKPSFTISCTDNPASSSTTFIISHDRSGSQLDVTVEVFDLSGRMLWSHSESGVSDGSTYTVTWNLTGNNGSRLSTGVYLYRVKLGSDSAVRTSKAKKLIVIGNN